MKMITRSRLTPGCSFKVGDKFIFDIESMKEYDISMPSDENIDKTHSVKEIQHYDELGYLITYGETGGIYAAQVNASWCKKVVD